MLDRASFCLRNCNIFVDRYHSKAKSLHIPQKRDYYFWPGATAESIALKIGLGQQVSFATVRVYQISRGISKWRAINRNFRPDRRRDSNCNSSDSLHAVSQEIILNTRDNVYGAVIMAQPLREWCFFRFI